MRYVGIDYGTKKVGLALSDEEGSIAFPHSVVPNDHLFQENILELLKKEVVSNAVVGHSLAHDGSENPVMEEIHTFKDFLETNGVRVVLEPEFLTTFQAKRNTEDPMADASAAALILQSFFDKEEGED